MCPLCSPLKIHPARTELLTTKTTKTTKKSMAPRGGHKARTIRG